MDDQELYGESTSSGGGGGGGEGGGVGSGGGGDAMGEEGTTSPLANQIERRTVLYDHLEQAIEKEGVFKAALANGGGVRKIFVCDNMLRQVYGAPDSMFNKVRADVNSNRLRPGKHAGQGARRDGEGRRARADAWITTQMAFFAEPQPNSGGSGEGKEGGGDVKTDEGDDTDAAFHMDRQNVGILYEWFVEEQREGKVEPGSISTFRRALAEVLIRLRIKVRSSRAVDGFCDTCDLLKKKVTGLPKKDLPARRLAVKEYGRHHTHVRTMRRLYAQRRQESIIDPEVMSSCHDMADQSKLTLPIKGKKPSKSAVDNSLFKMALFGKQ